jgi:hypothetical protein
MIKKFCEFYSLKEIKKPILNKIGFKKDLENNLFII